MTIANICNQIMLVTQGQGLSKKYSTRRGGLNILPSKRTHAETIHEVCTLDELTLGDAGGDDLC